MSNFDFASIVSDALAGAAMKPVTTPWTGLQFAAPPGSGPLFTPPPTLDDELTFMTGINATGHIAATSFWTWNNPSNPATYLGTSGLSKWGGDAAGSAGGTVKFFFDPASAWTSTEKTWLSAGLALWSAEANISFVVTTNANLAQLKFYRGNDGNAYESTNSTSAAVGGTTIPHPTAAGPNQSDGAYIHIDTSAAGFGPIDGNFDSFGGYPLQTLVHEEGHALGLGHGGPYNGNVDQTQQQYSPYDVRLWTLMSYIDNESVYSNIGQPGAKYAAQYPVMGANWGFNGSGYFYEPTTPMVLDIAAAQRIYGAATTGPLASGGQIFGFNTNLTGLIAPFFDFTQNQHPVITIWDGGTGNTLDLSGFTADSTVNLNPGAFSSANGMVDNIGIALDTKVDTAIGGTGNDTFTANNDGDTFYGGGGNDTFNGGTGNDLFTGGSGNDIFNGGTHVDTVSYANATAGVHVSLLNSAAQNTVGAGTDTLSSIEKLVGSAFADTLTAGTAGSTLNGGNGGDDLIGGPGSDILNGGGASDFADYGLATAGVTVNLTVTGFQNTVGAGSDELVGIEKVVGSNFNDTITGDGGINTLFGEAGNDVIVGGAGGDFIFGNAGNDTLTGGAGQDSMTGGAGADTFVFTDTTDTPHATPDLILDFVHGTDKIDLSAIDADTGTAGNQAFHLGGGGMHAGDMTFAYHGGTGQTEIDFWTGTHAPADGAIFLTGDLHATLTAGDFVL